MIKGIEQTEQLVDEIQRVFFKHPYSNHEIRISMLTILALVYKEELYRFPPSRDDIRVRFEKEIHALRNHVFDER